MKHLLRVLQALFGGVCLTIGISSLNSLRYVNQNQLILMIAGLSFLAVAGWFLWLATKGDL